MVEAGIAVKALLQGATPERKQEIEDLWDRYAPKVHVVEDARGVNISAGKGRIQFDHKTLEAIWLLGFNGWRSIETYSPAIILAGITGWALEDILRADDELAAFEMDYRHGRLGLALQPRASLSLASRPPTRGRTPRNAMGAAVMSRRFGQDHGA
jgi:hypothetical protein